MFKKIKYFIFFLLIPLPCLAVSINEIAWMGTDVSANDEWIELYSLSETDLTGWTLTAEDGTPNISLTGTIQEYFLLERTDDNTVPGVSADQIYTGALGNSGEKLELRNAEGELIDSVDSWIAGDNTTKQTMAKIDNEWQTTKGTPRAQNIASQEEEPEINQSNETEPAFAHASNYPPYAEAGPDITALINQEIIFDGSLSWDPDWDDLEYFWNFGDGSTDTQIISSHIYAIPGQYIATLKINDRQFADIDSVVVNIYDNSVIISEFLPNPEGSDEENEWIELYNQNDQIANLSGWQLSDSAKTFTFPENSLIAPHQYLVLKRPTTKISLNNDGDEVKLIFPNGEIASQVNYTKGEGSVAFKNGYFWTAVPTPGMSNIISNEEIEITEPAEQTTSLPEKITINLTETENFSVQENQEEPLNIQSQNILGKIQTLNKEIPDSDPTIILILSIIVSGILFTIWGLRFFH